MTKGGGPCLETAGSRCEMRGEHLVSSKRLATGRAGGIARLPSAEIERGEQGWRRGCSPFLKATREEEELSLLVVLIRGERGEGGPIPLHGIGIEGDQGEGGIVRVNLEGKAGPSLRRFRWKRGGGESSFLPESIRLSLYSNGMREIPPAADSKGVGKWESVTYRDNRRTISHG